MDQTVKVTFKESVNAYAFDVYINDRFATTIPIMEVISLFDNEQYACFQAGQLEFFMDRRQLNNKI